MNKEKYYLSKIFSVCCEDNKVLSNTYQIKIVSLFYQSEF